MINIELDIIREYKIITEQITVAKSQLERAKRDLQKNMDVYKPSDAKGIAYDNERVQTSVQQQDIMETAKNICILTDFIRELKQVLEELNSQRKELEDTINSLGDIRKQYIMYKVRYPRMSNRIIASKIHVSPRTLDNYIKQIKDLKKNLA